MDGDGNRLGHEAGASAQDADIIASRNADGSADGRTPQDAEPDVALPFALDELLGKLVGEGGAPVCHLWRHPRAFVIGSRDSRLPEARQALLRLEREGYSTLVRNSGGAAVPLDPGVVNLSLILPAENIGGGHGLNEDFERMYALIHRAVGSLGHPVGRGEVHGAYCPGDYDLQLGGLKFCGISQRRQVRATIIQAFVNVGGAGETRTGLVRAFYDMAGRGAPAADYPLVQAGRMTSLQEQGVVGEDGAAAFVQAVRQALPPDSSSPEGAGAAGTRVFRIPEPGELVGKAAELRQRYAPRH